jgi:putative ABC transport system permease protein
MNGELVELGWTQLALMAGLLVITGIIALVLRLGVTARLALNATRMAIQLLLVGLVLHWVFGLSSWWAVAAWASGMLLIAGWEVHRRQRRGILGWKGFAVGVVAMGLGSMVVLVVLLAVVVQPTPWWQPRYAIPLLGMLLGNTMTGIALALERMTAGVADARAAIEARLALGHLPNEALLPYRREAMRTALIPTINAMAAAGVVSLPGMMTGQILAGSLPTHAVRYQILIFVGIAAAVTGGALAAVWWASRHLIDERGRLRLDRLRAEK